MDREKHELARRDAEDRLRRVVQAAGMDASRYPHGNYSLWTTGLPAFANMKGDRSVYALSVSGLYLSDDGVQITMSSMGSDDVEVAIDKITIFNREMLVFLRDALSSLINGGVFADDSKGDK